MSDVELVNPVPVDEIGPWSASMITTFLGDPAEAVADAPSRAPSWDPTRSWGARADGRWVATLRTDSRRITVPGVPGDIAFDALTNVTVSATHRRQGLLRSMLTESLAAAKERGDPLSGLIAAEWPIYGRFGYAPSSYCADYTVRTRERGSQLLGQPSGGMRQVDAAELGDIAPGVFAQARGLRAGNIDRPSHWWDRWLGLNGTRLGEKRPIVHVVHQGDSGVDGYVSWISTGDWSLTDRLGEVTIRDLVATSDQAHLDIWQYLFSIDVVDQVHLHEHPVDEPLQWLLADGRLIRQKHRVDWVWLRILDLPAALSARRYSTEDSVVLDVIDPDGAGFAAGRYLLEGGPHGAQCTPTRRDADITVQQRALAACYLGGTSLASLAPAGLVAELTGGAIRRVDAMLSTGLAPWCATGF